MHDVRYDASNDEFLTTNPFAAAVLVFAGGANGEAEPIRVIQGPATRMNGPSRVEVDPVNNEIFVPNANEILVFPRNANGNVAPLRSIKGDATRLQRVEGLAVDTVHNRLTVGFSKPGGLRGMGTAGAQGWSEAWTEVGTGAEMGGLLIFDRTAQGNVAPRGVIQGPRTGIFIPEQLQAYSPKGWIVVSQSTDWPTPEPPDTFIGIWSVNDNGDIPPRWRIGGPTTMIKKPRGVALNPARKEILVADMRQNAVFTFHFPEMF